MYLHCPAGGRGSGGGGGGVKELTGMPLVGGEPVGVGGGYKSYVMRLVQTGQVGQDYAIT
jgi:hypothetical protein